MDNMSEKVSEKVEWIEYSGNRILKVDYSNLKSDTQKLQLVLNEAEEIQKQEPLGSVLRVNLIANSSFNFEAKILIREYTERILPYTKASASCGFTGMKAIIVRLINPAMKNFPTIEEACDWLIKQ